MKRLLFVIFAAALLLTSCTWQIPLTVYTSTLVPTSSLAPVDLAGPNMQVGSTYPYVNDTLLVAVPAGEFSMGHGGADSPVHQVFLKDFWISRTKVTHQQYAACVSYGHCTPPAAQDDSTFGNAADQDRPVVGVTYDQAAAYCAFLHGRLPTEAEWEKTARGPYANLYPWGNGAPSCDLLNFHNCIGATTDVTSYLQGRSYYGALDMEGNTFEWVADWYKDDYYVNSPVSEPFGPDNGLRRSVRSSSFQSDASQTAAATRFFDLPSSHRPDLGFRCAVDESSVLAFRPLPSSTPTTVVASSSLTPSLTLIPSLLPTLLADSATPAPLASLIPSLAPTDSIFTIVPTVGSLPTLPPPTLPNILPTPAPLPTLAPAPTLSSNLCQPLACILPAVWDALKCKCVTP